MNPVGARAPPPCAATFPGGKTSSTAAHSLMRHFCFSHRQLSLFAAAFLAITTPPHLEVCDCGAIQQIVSRVRGWSRSRFYSSWHGRQLPFKRECRDRISELKHVQPSHLFEISDRFMLKLSRTFLSPIF